MDKAKLTFVKIGTMPADCVFVRLGEAGEAVGGLVEFRPINPGEKWQRARITDIREGRLFLALE